MKGYTKYIPDEMVRDLGAEAALLAARLEAYAKGTNTAVVSIAELRSLFGWSKYTIHAAIEKLESHDVWHAKSTIGNRGFTTWNKGQKIYPLKGEKFTLQRLKNLPLNNKDCNKDYKEEKEYIKKKKENNSVPDGTTTQKAKPDVKVNKIFKKPSVDDVRAYCTQRANTIDPQHFIDYYESNGWKVGRNSMKDWRATIRTWEAKEKDKHYARRHYTSPTEAARAAEIGIALADGLFGG